MIKLENTEVIGWEHAIRGMRNPKNSWDRGDTNMHNRGYVRYDDCNERWEENGYLFEVGPNDRKLMTDLAAGGPVHAKYRRMIVVYVDITAPLYWWKEFDTYKVGTVANSCSTMHKIQDKEFVMDNFSYEHLLGDEVDGWNHPGQSTYGMMLDIVDKLNECRELYLKTKDKKYWWQMIQLLPSSYNQKRTIMLNYEVLANIYKSRKNHKLDEWREFCKWIEDLPYSEIITYEPESKKTSLWKPIEEYGKANKVEATYDWVFVKTFGKEQIKNMDKNELIDAFRALENSQEYLRQIYEKKFGKKIGEELTDISDIEFFKRIKNALHEILLEKLYIKDQLSSKFNTFVI